MAIPTDNAAFDSAIDELEIIQLNSFDTAFAVSPSLAAETKRRFMTLFVSVSQTRMAGSSGTVGKAHNAKGEVFAIKRLIPGAVGGARPSGEDGKFTKAQVSAFYEEYKAQLQLSNMKGFPKLYGFGMTGDEPVIVMEWVEGLTLASVRDQLPRGARAGAVSPKTIAQLGLGLFSILAGLAPLAERPVHRDISPSNIMLRTTARSVPQQVATGSFDLCLIDFGSATVISQGNPNFTMTTNVWRNGTPEYAPPEMLTYDAPNISALRQSPSIDVYATCSILYELACGATPFQVGKHPELSPYRRKMDFDPAPLPDELGPLGRAIMGGLEREQANRLSPRELCDLCAAYLRGDASAEPGAQAAHPGDTGAGAAIPPIADYETAHLSMPAGTAQDDAGSARGVKHPVLVGAAAAIAAALLIAVPYIALSLGA